MAVYVNVYNYVLDKKVSWVFTDSDFALIDKNWNNKDRVIVELSEQSALFANKSTWDELETIHWRILIDHALEKFFQLNAAEQTGQNGIVQTVTLLVTGLVKMLKVKCDVEVEMLTINMINEDIVDYSFSSKLNLEIPVVSKETRKPNLSIIFDRDE